MKAPELELFIPDELYFDTDPFHNVIYPRG